MIGLHWGDEGKGKIVDLLTADHDLVVRYNGGANAGHTVKIGTDRYALHLLPSGVLSPGTLSVIGNGVVVDPEQVLAEIDTLATQGVNALEQLRISDRAHVVMPWHQPLDAAYEWALSHAGDQATQQALGTTGRGIGPAYADRATRSTAVRMGDLLDPDHLQALVSRIAPLKKRVFESICNGHTLDRIDVKSAFDVDRIVTRYAACGQRLTSCITDTTYLLHDQVAADRRILFEGANACLLDVDHGTFPYVTSSNCSALGITAGTGLPAAAIGNVIGVVKAYCTRVGSGPFPTEETGAVGNTIRERGHEYGTTTGRPRRCGWLDLVATRYAAMLTGATGLAITLLDVLEALDEINVCVGYRLDDRGDLTDRFIPDAHRLARIQPVYETLPGFGGPVSTARSADSLPQGARDYLDFIEQFVGVPIRIVSVGPERTETLRV
ncbi:MAG: adenylosuccinate synthase [Planctomycetes bacterium]|nr:adenylosuccinate synthase [Planctomycetota bacterium]